MFKSSKSKNAVRAAGWVALGLALAGVLPPEINPVVWGHKAWAKIKGGK